ncbi:MAG: carboxypeptidase regulatory-like domain-containing protein [Candidatus Eremiobacteraeota bacterium]|nr:carboxypeptidase regulatory-like domain-containing protein [Candidatus Eremiobacteraeota bacterium]MBV9055674.1 carboxypeptidase regulatory-like domain-containing protein [Candidatus Eremiobacteraeota bacterium]MBV9698908.1 carboxypeptidase regulatory-like domain-containing protein [Candidatus Eremiobacteraeota bacterium]
MQFAILLALSNFFFWTLPVDWQRDQQSVVISGTVVDEATGAPVSGATVYATSGANLAQMTSDSNGRFVFLTLLPGLYSLCASKPGYTLDCRPRDSKPAELFDGFEYGATVVLAPASN